MRALYLREWKEVFSMRGEDRYYLEYALAEGQRVILLFDNMNDRDGCHISLDMYKVQLGPVDNASLQRILEKFRGEIVTPSS